MNAGHGNLADLRNIDLSRPIHDHSQIRLNLSPYPDLQFVSRPNDVVGRDLLIYGEKVLGGWVNKDCPNKGKIRPTESATICWNSVSAWFCAGGCGCCDGFNVVVAGVY